MFQAVFENSPVGLVLVNSDTTIRDANNYIFNMFKMEPGIKEGRRFGNFFNCTVVSEGGTCGCCQECGECSVRRTLTKVLKEGTSMPETVMAHKFLIEGQEQKKWFKISASRIENDGDAFAIVSFADITIQKEYEELLNYRLSLDLATGTSNKYALMNTLKSLTEAGKDFTVAMIDFDNFKSINDSYGHVAGDKVINLFCTAAMENTRKNDILGRFGGEEFMIIFMGGATGVLIKALQRISKSFQEACWKELRIRPTFSAGMSEACQASQQAGVDSIIEEADSNLYLSKWRGKNMITSRGLTITIE
jgi:diguanylate cyclase (GGDEF)-like protein